MVHVAGPQEGDAVAALMQGFRDHLGYDEPTDAEVRAGVERLLADVQTDFLLAVREDAPVGVCQLRYRWGIWLGGVDCLLEDLYVAARARGAGVGRSLVAAAVAHARDERGARRMELDVNERNTAAIALYERFGFRTASTASAYEGGRDLYFRLHL